jgi:transposase, IS5 family
MKKHTVPQQYGLSMMEDRRLSFERGGKRVTKREAFLQQMDRVVPWPALIALIEPFYPKAGNGRRPIGLELMLRIHFLQHWFNLADEICEDALYDSSAFRAFAGIDLGEKSVPDATSLLRFRHLLEEHELGELLFTTVNAHLRDSGIKVSGGTLVDATILAAPSSTKNQDKQRDPEMHQTKKGNQWHFGMKLHIGADSQSGAVHSAEVTAANVHDSQQLPDLLHGDETRVYGDSAYRGQDQHAAIQQAAPNAKDFTNERAYRNRPLSKEQKRKNRYKSSIRAKVEYVFLVIKKLWGFTKVRYRGLAKNKNRLLTSLALANLFIVRQRLQSRRRIAHAH